MKKLILALSLGLLLPLSACGSNSGNGGQDTVFSKFDGKLENGAVLRILENDTAVKQGYLKELGSPFFKLLVEKQLHLWLENLLNAPVLQGYRVGIPPVP